jgi:hypothetical protein
VAAIGQRVDPLELLGNGLSQGKGIEAIPLAPQGLATGASISAQLSTRSSGVRGRS